VLGIAPEALRKRLQRARERLAAVLLPAEEGAGLREKVG
jgi:DNA-directed RNA polymerase specialized sigma24 family protein